MRYYKEGLKTCEFYWPRFLDWVAAATLWVLAILIVGCSLLMLLRHCGVIILAIGGYVIPIRS